MTGTVRSGHCHPLYKYIIRQCVERQLIPPPPGQFSISRFGNVFTVCSETMCTERIRQPFMKTVAAAFIPSSKPATPPPSKCPSAGKYLQTFRKPPKRHQSFSYVTAVGLNTGVLVLFSKTASSPHPLRNLRSFQLFFQIYLDFISM